MTATVPDSTLDRLLRHMAWANASLIDVLATLPPDALAFASPGSEDWTAGRILAHFVGSAGFYAARLEASPIPNPPATPVSSNDVHSLAAICAGYDARLRVQAALPDAVTTYVREGATILRARSTIAAQAVHHATEHRAQIAAALAAHGVVAVDLDELDVWSYSDAEGQGA